MKRLALCVGLLIAGPVWAEEFPFKGQWEIRSVNPNYVAIVLIDGERRVTADAPSDQGRPAKFKGYVAEATGERLILHITDGRGVGKMHCDVRTREMLHCYNIRPNGDKSDNFLLVKTGPGPHRLTPSR